MMTSQPILTKTSVSIVNQTKKLIDYRRQEGKHAGLYINGATVDMVNSFKFLGVHITQDFACNIYIYGAGDKKQNKTKKQASSDGRRSILTCCVKSVRLLHDCHHFIKQCLCSIK